MHIGDFQRMIEERYLDKDRERGLEGTYMWFCEEVGELTRALRRGLDDELEGEFADVFAYLATLASMSGIDLEQAVRAKYGLGEGRGGDGGGSGDDA